MKREGSLLCSQEPAADSFNPVRIFPHYLPKMPSDIILPSITKSSKWSLPFSFSKQNTV